MPNPFFVPRNDCKAKTYRYVPFRLRSKRDFDEIQSATHDTATDTTPIIHTELVNWRSLSPAAAAARTTLMESMIANAEREDLGIEGTPAAKGIYVSVLKQTGLHQRQGHSYGFGLPERDACKIIPMWNRIDQFLGTAENGRVRVADLFRALTAPPYGIRDGLLPIFLLARIKCDESEIALFESGAYVPDLSSAVMERLVMAPDKFEIQRYEITGVRAQVFKLLSTIFDDEDRQKKQAREKTTLLTVVKPLVRFVLDLPSYTRSTVKLTPMTLRVRSAISLARDPHQLVFNDLPNALDVSEAKGAKEKAGAHTYISHLKIALRELAAAYDLLLDGISEKLVAAFSLSRSSTEVRPRLASRSKLILPDITNMRLKAFALQLADGGRNDKNWIESLASCVVGKPPSQWIDTDIARFESALSELVVLFTHTEELVAFDIRKGHASSQRLVRLALTEVTGQELHRIVYEPNGNSDRTRQLVTQLRGTLASSGLDANGQLVVLAQLLQDCLTQNTDK